MPHSLFEEELDGLHFVKAAREELQGVIGATTTKKLASLSRMPKLLDQLQGFHLYLRSCCRHSPSNTEADYNGQSRENG